MPKTILASFLMFGIPFLVSVVSKKTELKVGDPAPEFTLPDQTNKTHSLKEFAGQYVVLYFYPKDDTPGCTTEACSFRDEMTEITSQGYKVIGISVDTVKSHLAFVNKYGLNFLILADPTKKTVEAYGVLGLGGVAERTTFIIGPDGKIAAIFPKVNPKDHAKFILSELAKLKNRK